MKTLMSSHYAYQVSKISFAEQLKVGRVMASIWEIFASDFKKSEVGFPGGAVVENLPANAGDTGSSPGLGRSHMPRSN